MAPTLRTLPTQHCGPINRLGTGKFRADKIAVPSAQKRGPSENSGTEKSGYRFDEMRLKIKGVAQRRWPCRHCVGKIGYRLPLGTGRNRSRALAALLLGHVGSGTVTAWFVAGRLGEALSRSIHIAGRASRRACRCGNAGLAVSRTAELNDRVARVEQMTYAELL
jgi:hypothetical protein